MKAAVLLLFFFGLSSCKKESPLASESCTGLAGTVWVLDYSREIGTDTVYSHIPPEWKRYKMYSGNRWSFSGYDFQKQELAGMGGGTYTLVDEQYEETIEYHHHAPFIGKKFRAHLRFDEQYLYQRGQVDSLVLEERWRRID